MNFALLNNGTVSTFSNNIIGFPSSQDDQFVLTRENINGTITYSWTKPLNGGTASLDFITTTNLMYITTTNRKISISGNVLVFDIQITNISDLCNNYDEVYIKINDVIHYITPYIKYQQIIIDNDLKEVEISSNIEEEYIQLLKIHRL